MKEYLEKIKNFIRQKEKLGYLFFLINLFLISFSLFIPDFNILKFINFVILILVGLSLYFYFQVQRRKEEKISFFQLVQNLLDNLKEGIVIYDDNFKIVFVNASFSKLVALKKETLLNLKVDPGMIRNKKYEILANIFFPFIQGYNLKIISQNPETIDVNFTSPEEKYFLISYLDIYLDKKYKLRVVLDRTEDVLESQRKLEFVQLVSHHLLTPLTEIRWNLEVINIENLSDEDKKSFQTALRSIKNSLILAESLLNLARIEFKKIELKTANIDTEKLIIFILDILKDKIEEKGIKVNVEIEEKVSTIVGDESILKMTLFSLIENAVVYNRVGGSINIKIKKQEQRPYLEITIEDTGIGMSKKDLDNLFKKYYRGERAKNLKSDGFGIGLYNAKSLINIHGGEIKVESQENKGTTVKVYLPLDPNLIPKT
jgi:signal transduction histidine kinase